MSGNPPPFGGPFGGPGSGLPLRQITPGEIQRSRGGYAQPPPANAYGPAYNDPAFQPYVSDLYLRKWTLTLGQGTVSQPGTGLTTDPATAPGFINPNTMAGGTSAGGDTMVITSETPGMDFRMTFKVRHADDLTPGTAEIRIYNLSDNTAAGILQEFNWVTLQAGYINGHFGKIFEGTIKQFKRGRESAIDSFLDIYAADGDAFWNGKFLNRTRPGGIAAQLQALTDAGKASGITMGQIDPPPSSGLIGGIAPERQRGAISYAMFADEASEYSRTTGSSWSIQNGVLQNINATNYLNMSDIPVINSGTGMIGWPEQTQDGITVTTLLNPDVFVKQRMQLNNADINQYILPQQQRYFQYGQYDMVPQFYTSLNADGIYVILVIDHEGDTRGNNWYTHLTCESSDPTQPFGIAVTPLPSGTPSGF